jgi:hypothetical protein
MVPTSTIYIYEVFKTIHMLWMGRRIHHHATCKEFRELAEFLDKSEAANESWLVG